MLHTPISFREKDVRLKYYHDSSVPCKIIHQMRQTERHYERNKYLEIWMQTLAKLI